VVYLDKLMYVAYSVLTGAVTSYNATAIVNGQTITLTASYSSNIITLTGSFSLQSPASGLQIVVYFGNIKVDAYKYLNPSPPGVTLWSTVSPSWTARI